MEQNSFSTITETKTVKAMRVFILTALSIVIFYPPYLQGLFFEQHQLPTAIYVFTLFIIFWVYKWLKRDLTFLKTPIEYAAVGFIAVYLVSILTAVHTRSAIAEWLKYCMYFAVFYMVSEMAENLKVKIIFLWTIVFSAVGVSIIGLNSAMGGTLVSLLNKAFSKLGVQGDLFFGLFVDYRINSTLQYPNALASYVMAVFFIVIGLLLSESKFWLKALYGACAYVLFLTFMLTKSRGAQILFPVAVLLFMLVSPGKTRIKSAAHVLFMAVPAVGVSLLILPYLSADITERKALILFAAGMLITIILAVMVELIGNLLQKIHWLVYAGLSVILAILLPLGIIYIVNASVPLDLSHAIEEANGSKSIVRDVTLSPGDYVLRFNAEAKIEKEQPYVYYASISGKTGDDIIFGGSTQLANKTFQEGSEFRQETILFKVPEDTNLVTVSFINYYSGTGVTLNNAEIIDPISGNVIKKVILKNKYNLESLITRFENIGQEKSGVVRIIFYKDGLKIFKDRWLLGSGGGAWEQLYRQYQSYSYPSTQAHNYLLQLGIETGIPGILVLLILVFFLVIGYIKYVKRTQDKPYMLFINAAVITAIAALLMHALIDFDFSESAMLLLFWQLIAIFNRQAKDSSVFGKQEAKNKKLFSNKLGLTAGATVGIVTGAIVLGISISLYSAAVHAKKAYESIRANEIEKAINHIKLAIRLDKTNEKYIIGYNPLPAIPYIKTGLADIVFTKANLMQNQVENSVEPTESEYNLFKQQVNEMNLKIAELEKKATNNLALTTNLAGYHFQMGDPDKGIEYLNRAITLCPFESSFWHTKINVYYELVRTYFNNNEEEKAYQYLKDGLNIIREVTEINKRNMNPFVFSEDVVETLQNMQYLYDYWDTYELANINEVVHYTLPYLDVNLDQIPDQWRSGDSGLIGLTASEQGIQVQAKGSSYISTQNKVKFEKGKRYVVKVKLDRPVDKLAFDIVGLANQTVLKAEDGNRYAGEILIEKEPKVDGNQLRVYFESDCVIESLLLLKQE